MVFAKSDERGQRQVAPSDRDTRTLLGERTGEAPQPRLPDRASFSCDFTFTPLSDGAQTPRRFHPHIKVHTPGGDDALSIAQAMIPHASPECRLRSDYLAQTLRIFSQKVADLLPEEYSVQISLSPIIGRASSDVVHLIRQSADGSGQPILERHYEPFNGGGFGGILPSDKSRNVVLKIEERLFYYTTFMAIKKVLENELARRGHSSSERDPNAKDTPESAVG